MPKYKITEVDNTGTLTLAEQPNIVYVPGGASGVSSATAPKLYTRASDLIADGDVTTTTLGTSVYYAKDTSFYLAIKLLRLGMQVLYQGFALSNDKITITDDNWADLEDKNLYNVRFLTAGGYPGEDVAPKSMIACAANRGDCVALIDHPSMETYSVSGVRTYVEGLKSATSTRQKDALAFASAFTPWFTASLEDENGLSKDVEVPASFGYLFAYARSVQSNPLWKAVAGVFRGIIPELKDISYVLNNAECEVLQARATTSEVDLDATGDNAGIAINPIAYRRYSGFNGGFNYVICGNRTMHNNEGYTIATSFLNVRLLISEISKSLYDASVTYTFEQNSEVLWNNFKNLITPLLNRMQSGEGIEGYRLDRIPTTKKARLCAKLTIVPIEAVEDFELTIALEDSIEVTE